MLGENFLAKTFRSQLGKLEERLSQTQSEVRPEKSLSKEIQDTLEAVISRCETSEKNQKEASACLQTVSQKVENLEEIRKQITELEQKLSNLNQPIDNTTFRKNEHEQASKLDSKDDLESVKCFVTEKLSDMKDLVSGPLSVVFDAIRSDDFVGEDNFLTFSKANQFIKLS